MISNAFDFLLGFNNGGWPGMVRGHDVSLILIVENIFTC